VIKRAEKVEHTPMLVPLKDEFHPKMVKMTHMFIPGQMKMMPKDDHKMMMPLQ